MKIVVGFTIFLEHILHYEGKEEKGRMAMPPRVHLGGGGYNIVKTLETLGVKRQNLFFLGMVGGGVGDPEREGVRSLLSKETMRYTLFPLREWTSTSFYLIPQKGNTWAMGYRGNPLRRLDPHHIRAVSHASERAGLRILNEVSSDPNELVLAKVFFKKYDPGQISLLIPGMSLLLSGKTKALLPFVDCLILNEDEAKAFWKRNPTKSDLLKLPVPYILITRGSKEAWLKAGGRVIVAQPKKVLAPRYIGGAGDATAAAFAYYHFVKEKSAAESLRRAMEIGRKTLFLPTSYYSHKKI